LQEKRYNIMNVYLQIFYTIHIEIIPSLCHHYVMVTPHFPRRDGLPGRGAVSFSLRGEVVFCR